MSRAQKRLSLPGATLYVARKATKNDKIAEEEVTALVPDIDIYRTAPYNEMTVPRLAYGRSFYRGLPSIRSFLLDECESQGVPYLAPVDD